MHSSRTGTARRRRLGATLGVLLAALWCAPPDAAAPYTSESERSPQVSWIQHQEFQDIAREAQERYRKRVPIPDAVAEATQGTVIVPRPGPILETSPAPVGGLGDLIQQLAVAAGCCLAGLVALRRLAPEFCESIGLQFNPWKLVPAVPADRSPTLLAEEKALAEFVSVFKIGPVGPQPSKAEATPAAEAARKRPRAKPSSRQQFFDRAPRLLLGARQLLQDLGRGPSEAELKRTLGELDARIRKLKALAGQPELLPVWQVTSGLEGLVGQLADRIGRVTPSTLRTVGNCLDLLQDLCKPGLRADLCTQPPVRMLAVDDDAISRQAISLALKKGLTAPDLAPDGAAGLALAAQHAYDVIFLDVEMPGMDGYEICSKIHQPGPNATTPVVFVTSHTDFDARAKSALCGGNDLISKPFLVFELTVKALTFAVRKRLQDATAAAPATETSKSSEGAPAAATTAAEVEAATTTPDPAGKGLSPRQRRRNRELARLGSATERSAAPPPGATANVSDAPDPANGPVANAETPGSAPEPAVPAAEPFVLGAASESSAGSATEFITHASTLMGLVRELAQKLSHLTNSAARQELLETLHQRVHCLSVSTTRPELQPAAQLSAALEGLLKKISQQDDRVTPSALKAVVDAVDLLQELYEDRVETELATEPPIALLVVDDDPIARRVMTGALQIAFGKPDAVEDGPSALALAEKKAFDVMFLDVQMPGMDGFELCPKLHKIPLNRNTPVVFVTGYTDLKFREMSRLSGGTDFISKPILASEVKLKALTMALQRRLYARRHPGEVEADSEDRAAEGSAAGVNVESAAPVAA